MDPSKNPHADPKKSSTRKSAVQISAEDSGSLLSALDQVVFSAPDDRSQKFNMALVHGQSEMPLKVSRYDERDYQSHRRESFPHQYHQPLKPIKSFRRKSSTKLPDGGEKSEPVATTNRKPKSPPPQKPISDSFEIDEPFDPVLIRDGGSFPFRESVSVVERPPPYNLYDDLMENYSKKAVQFEVGGLPINSSSKEETVEKKKHKSHRSKYEDPQWRLKTGAEKDATDVPLLLQDPENDMPDLDKDDLTTHRFGDSKGYRRHKFVSGATGNGVTHGTERKYDHQPHEIFVELDILSGLGDEREWKEAARWIKYEEDVEEDVNRWGKPHIGYLSFHSLINLRRLIENGVILLDLEERDLPGVAYRVVDQMVINELINAEDKGFVMRSLLLRHRHINQSDKNWKLNLKRNAGSLTSLHNSFDEKTRGKPSVVSMEPALLTRRNSATVTSTKGFLDQNTIQGKRNGSFVMADLQEQLEHTSIDLSKVGSISHMSEEDLRWMVNKESILRRIPIGAEASVVLVGKDENLEGPALAFVRLAESVYMPNITEVPIPVRFIFILLGPSTGESFDMDYKEIGRCIATLMSNQEFHAIAYKADDRKDLLKGIHDYLDESIVLPPGEYEKELLNVDDLKAQNEALRLRKQRMSVSAKAGSAGRGRGEGGDDGDGDPAKVKLLKASKKTQTTPLKRTRRCFGGLVSDIKNRYRYYLSDFKDGFSFQCMAAILFIALAQIAGSIAFGGLLSEKTKMKIGISESLLASGISGGIFSLFSGQPLLIVGVTGPLLLFEESLYQFCADNEIAFLPMRIWIGVWLTCIALVFVGFEASVFVRFFTRFTQEIFASLICLTFIAESIVNLVKVYQDHPLMDAYGVCINGSVPNKGEGAQPNTALLTTILMFGTFGVAWSLRSFRNSTFLTNIIRTTLGNFAVPIAILTLFLVDFLIKETVTKKLDVGGEFGPTDSGRSWFVNPIDGMKSWVPAISFLPALLLFIIIFMETSIGELLVAKHEHRLVKGTGFHLDVLLICIINTVISFFGLPYVSIALVRAVAHVSALIVFTTNHAPGEKPQITGVKEQRLTSLAVSTLAGASVAMAAALQFMPLSVLFGVFLFMGISGIYGIQFFERVALVFKQVENHPQVPFVRKVRTLKMHLFTLIQACWLAVLWAIKYTPAGLAFPFILAILPPFRIFVLPWMFKSEELAALDSSGDDKKEPVIHVQNSITLPEKSKTQINSLLNEQAMIDMKSKGDGDEI